jgi:hypothetical protein
VLCVKADTEKYILPPIFPFPLKLWLFQLDVSAGAPDYFNLQETKWSLTPHVHRNGKKLCRGKLHASGSSPFGRIVSPFGFNFIIYSHFIDYMLFYLYSIKFLLSPSFSHQNWPETSDIDWRGHAAEYKYEDFFVKVTSYSSLLVRSASRWSLHRNSVSMSGFLPRAPIPAVSRYVVSL